MYYYNKMPSQKNNNNKMPKYVCPGSRSKVRTHAVMGMNEFPELVKGLSVQEKPKIDFKGLFKNVENKRLLRKANALKKGWIKLTKEGVVDSLTPEQREQEEAEASYNKMRNNVEQMTSRWEQHTKMRLERDGYLSDYSVNSPSEESFSEEDEDEDEDEYEDEYEENEHLEDSKWLTA